MNFSRVLTILAMILLVPLLGAAGKGDDAEAVSTQSERLKRTVAGDEAVDRNGAEILKLLEARYAGVKTVKGSFTQVTVDTTFGEKIESRGSFYLKKPNRLRIDYARPHETTLLVTDRTLYRYVAQLKQVERYRIDPSNSIVETNYMLLGFGADTREVLRAYKVNLLRRERGQAVLRLVPEHPEEASFKSIEMTVDTKAQIPVEFRVAQLDGTEAVVHINPSSIVIDAPLQDNLFRPVFASDAQVVDMK